jgi:hypothetical protein
MRSWWAAGLVSLLVAGGCARGEHDGYVDEPDEPRERPAAMAQQPSAPPMTAADSAEARARIAARGDSVRAAFDQVRVLGAREVANLRRDRNAEQIATARSLGVRVSGEGEIERLRRQGRLVALGDSTPYWILRNMEHSTPYLTPDAHAMLVELGRRFHARLDSLGLPRYRMRVTSVLRTDDTQTDLRRTNPNASRTVSAHEFGTTLDVSHERFAVPAEPPPGNGGAPAPALEGRQGEVAMLEEVGKEHARALQAELGRAITEMREQGALQVMMEDRQPVYHMTVARRFATAD